MINHYICLLILIITSWFRLLIFHLRFRDGDHMSRFFHSNFFWLSSFYQLFISIDRLRYRSSIRTLSIRCDLRFGDLDDRIIFISFILILKHFLEVLDSSLGNLGTPSIFRFWMDSRDSLDFRVWWRFYRSIDWDVSWRDCEDSFSH